MQWTCCSYCTTPSIFSRPQHVNASLPVESVITPYYKRSIYACSATRMFPHNNFTQRRVNVNWINPTTIWSNYISPTTTTINLCDLLCYALCLKVGISRQTGNRFESLMNSVSIARCVWPCVLWWWYALDLLLLALPGRECLCLHPCFWLI